VVDTVARNDHGTVFYLLATDTMHSRRARVWVVLATGTAIAAVAAAAAPARVAEGSWSPVSVELGPGCGSGSVLAIGSDAQTLAAWSGCTESSPAATTLGTGSPGEPFWRTGQLRRSRVGR
jgi:hypothetical protein